MKASLKWTPEGWKCSLPKGEYEISTASVKTVSASKSEARAEAKVLVARYASGGGKITTKSALALSEESRSNLRDIIRRLGIS